MILSASTRIVAIKKPTQAKFFKDLKVGDILSVGLLVKGIAANRGSLYATNLDVMCLNTGAECRVSINNFCRRLENFEVQDA